MSKVGSAAIAAIASAKWAAHLGEELLEFDQARNKAETDGLQLSLHLMGFNTIPAAMAHSRASQELLENFSAELGHAMSESFDVLWLAHHLTVVKAWELVKVPSTSVAEDTALVWSDQNTHLRIDTVDLLPEHFAGREYDYGTIFESRLWSTKRPTPRYLLNEVLTDKMTERLQSAVALIKAFDIIGEEARKEGRSGEIYDPLEYHYSRWVNKQVNLRGRKADDYFAFSMLVPIGDGILRILRFREESGDSNWYSTLDSSIDTDMLAAAYRNRLRLLNRMHATKNPHAGKKTKRKA